MKLNDDNLRERRIVQRLCYGLHNDRTDISFTVALLAPSPIKTTKSSSAIVGRTLISFSLTHCVSFRLTPSDLLSVGSQEQTLLLQRGSHTRTPFRVRRRSNGQTVTSTSGSRPRQSLLPGTPWLSQAWDPRRTVQTS